MEKPERIFGQLNCCKKKKKKKNNNNKKKKNKKKYWRLNKLILNGYKKPRETEETRFFCV